ncbi:hypothetical protein [Helicobacter cetorum]|uniref:Lipoprotein n=1 Tax=Helicobacter cetorum (strain ATCC BAA-540 / CCUG 52418 / MIT 99-5656) TaxID=1163745 RepID=I0ERL7_HELCM|nr:hypothetical protein [Helicobacter cetorum]AFI05586.1 hypothetical protein HCD_02850 [Helicobacter cetorum MIT 99-5656]
MYLRIISIICIALLFVGCYTLEVTYGNLGVFSNKKLPKNIQVETSGHVEGKNCVYYVFPFFFFNLFKNAKKGGMEIVVQKAIEERHKRGFKGNVLTDAKMYRKGGYCFLFANACLVVERNLSTITKK